MDAGNTFFRVGFFTELMNQSVFGGALWLFLLVVLMLLLALRLKDRRKSVRKGFFLEHQGVMQIGFVTLGYFLVVAKTALLNAEEANRYELPIYGFCMLLMIAAIYYPMKSLVKKYDEEHKTEGSSSKIQNIVRGIGGLLTGIALLFQISALMQDKVQFLYKEDADNVQWAFKHKDEAIVFLYNPNNVWMIWDESEELMQYESIYFVSLADDSAITDEILTREKEIYVYASRMEEADMIMDRLLMDNPNLNEKEKIRELLYFDLYYLSGE